MLVDYDKLRKEGYTLDEIAMREKCAEITQLKADLVDLQEAYDKTMPGMITKLAVQENKDLKIDFNKFGGHTADCAAIEPWSGQERPKGFPGSIHPDVECDCGYQQAKERWE